MISYFFVQLLVGAALGEKTCYQSLLKSTTTCGLEDYTLYYTYDSDSGKCVQNQACEPVLTGNEHLSEEDCKDACRDLLRCGMSRNPDSESCPFGYSVYRYRYDKTQEKCIQFLTTACTDGSTGIFYSHAECLKACKQQ
uniref:Putative kunitz-type protease inhibitor-like protein n=1 Tax=Amblyomma triste TaxID=251400 RepID=A0A023G6S3_AMBTT